MRDHELTLRKMSLQIEDDSSISKDLGSVLDELPVSVILADKNSIQYMNKQAFKLMNCRKSTSNSDSTNPLDGAFCLDPFTCSVLTPLDQLVYYLSSLDKRLKLISRDNFLEAMINMATDEALYLNFCQKPKTSCGSSSESCDSGGNGETGSCKNPSS